VPGPPRARMTGNETSAIASLKVVTASQVAYSASWSERLRNHIRRPERLRPARLKASCPPTLAPSPAAEERLQLYAGQRRRCCGGSDDCNGTPTTTAHTRPPFPRHLGRPVRDRPPRTPVIRFGSWRRRQPDRAVRRAGNADPIVSRRSGQPSS
jgi:hypothetical protein